MVVPEIQVRHFLDADGTMRLAVRIKDDPDLGIGQIERGVKATGQIHILIGHADEGDLGSPPGLLLGQDTSDALRRHGTPQRAEADDQQPGRLHNGSCHLMMAPQTHSNLSGLSGGSTPSLTDGYAFRAGDSCPIHRSSS